MIRELVEAFCVAIKPPTREPVHIWASKNVRVDSDISEFYTPDSGPYWNQILADVFDNRFKEICVVAPPGCGKSTAIEVGVAYAASEDPGDTLVTTDSDERLQDWLDTRLNPVLQSCEPLKPLMPARAAEKKKKLVQMRHMFVMARPANEKALQQVSVRYAWGDEVWLWAHGLINYLRKRHHDRWNRKTVLLSQAGHKGSWTKDGDFQETEWFTACETGDLFELFWKCDACGELNKYDDWSLLKWEGDEDKDNIDWLKVRDTLRLQCACGNCYRDTATNRRALSSRAQWVLTREGSDPTHRTYVIPAMSVHRIEWLTLGREWISAIVAKLSGDTKPFFQFWTQRLSRFWAENPFAKFEKVRTGGYKASEYISGEKIPNEVARGMFVDVQQTHFWAVARAYASDGSSRLLFRGRIETIESVVSICDQYKVPRGHVLIDSRWGGKQMVFEWALKYGLQPAMGSNQNSFIHPTLNGPREYRLWSPMQTSRTMDGRRVRYIQWASDPIKDILANLKAGKGVPFLVPDDIDDQYQRQMNSEHKKVQPDGTARWTKHQKDNHFWDCEAMGVFFALYSKVMRVAIDVPENPDAPAEVDSSDKA